MRVSARDKREFTEWLNARQTSLIKAARAICFDSQNADDVLQEALTDIYKRWDKVRDYENLDGYVIRVMVSKHADLRRKWARRAEESTIPWDASESLLGDIDDSELVIERVLVQSALRSLSADQRAVLFLIYEYGFTIKEVAHQLELPVGTAASHLARGRDAVERFVSRKFEISNGAHRSIENMRLDPEKASNKEEIRENEIEDAEVIE